jgi:hypothetical protein
LGDKPGFEIVSPMAAVILGGLVTATLINLFIIPALYLRLGVSRVEDLGLVPVTGAAQEGMLGGMSAGK